MTKFNLRHYAFLLLIVTRISFSSPFPYQAIPSQIDEAEAEDEYSPDYCKRKFKSFTRMNIVGLSCIGVAGASLVTGICLVSTADVRTWEETQAAQQINPDTTFEITSEDRKMISGILLIVGTIPFTAAGMVLSIIGSKKRREYKRRLQFSGIQLGLSDKYTSIKVSFQF